MPPIDATGAAEQAADALRRGADAAAARILVGGDDVGLEEIFGGLDLALAELDSGLQLALLGERPLHRPALHRAAAVDDGEAARLLDEHLDDRLGAAEVQLAPPLVLGLDDGEHCRSAVAQRGICGDGVGLHPCGPSWPGVAGLRRGRRGKDESAADAASAR